MSWELGDVSGSETLTTRDHLRSRHINELRTALDNVALAYIAAFNVKKPAYGATGDGELATDGSISASSKILNVPSATFSVHDVGKLVGVKGAGSLKSQLTTTIASYSSPTQVVLTQAASTTVSGAETTWGTDDYDALTAASDAANAAGGGLWWLPEGRYMVRDTIRIYPLVVYDGAGAAAVIDTTGMNVAGSHKYTLKSTSTASKTDFTVRNLAFKNYFSPGTGTTYATLPATSGILISNARRVHVTDNLFEGSWNASTIGLNPDTSNDDLGALNIKQVIFKGNNCNDVLGGLQGYSEDRVIWANNHFDGVGDDACAFLSANNDDPGSARAIAVGNTFKNGRPQNVNGVYGVGVFLKVDGGGNGPENVVEVITAENVVDDSYIAFYLANCSEITAVANICHTSYQSAFYLSGSVSKGIMAHNQIHDPNTSGSGSHAGLQAVSASHMSYIGNKFFGTASGAKQGMNLEGSYSNIIASQNTFDSCGVFAIYAETVANSSFTGNVFSGSMNKGILITGSMCEVSGNIMGGSYTSGKISHGAITDVSIHDNPGNNDASISSNNPSINGTLSVEDGILGTATASSFDIQPGASSFLRFLNKNGALAATILAGEGSTLALYKAPTDTTYLFTAYKTADTTTIGFRLDGSARVDMNNDSFRLRTAKTPASASDTGTQGDICWDSNYVYVCIATNTWKRSALAAW